MNKPNAFMMLLIIVILIVFSISSILISNKMKEMRKTIDECNLEGEKVFLELNNTLDLIEDYSDKEEMNEQQTYKNSAEWDKDGKLIRAGDLCFDENGDSYWCEYE